MSLLVPLSSVDQAGTETSLSVFGYVLRHSTPSPSNFNASSPSSPSSLPSPGLDADALRAAALRLVEKWRLLAGTVEYSSLHRGYAIRVPLGPLDPRDERLRFTRTALPDTKLPAMGGNENGEKGGEGMGGKEEMGEDDACTLKPPAYKHFVHRDTAGALKTLAKTRQPILSIHVTAFADYTCVGIAAPHGVLDGTGQGALTQYLDAELHGRPWTPPPFAPANILQAALDALNSTPYPSPPPSPSTPNEKAQYSADYEYSNEELLSDLKRELVPVTARSVAALAARVGYEYLWHRAEDRALFLGRRVVERLAAAVKRDVRARFPGGERWVSTGDVLYMWLVQAACADEARDARHTVGLMSAVSMRPILTAHTKNPDFQTYPHNCILPAALPLLTKSSLQSTPLAELCLTHRETLDTARSLAYVRAWTRGVGTSVPARRVGHDAWICSNQIVSGAARIDFAVRGGGGGAAGGRDGKGDGGNGGHGGEKEVKTVAYFYFMAPIMPDHTLLINELNGGYVVQGCLRRARWAAVDRALQRLLQQEA